jgi:hypothetical protein
VLWLAVLWHMAWVKIVVKRIFGSSLVPLLVLWQVMLLVLNWTKETDCY